MKAMESDVIWIRLLDDTRIAGSGPLILIGANGSGKSRYGAQLALQFGYDRIPAQRNTSANDTNMQTLREASERRRQYTNYQKDAKGQANDAGFIYDELMAEKLEESIAYTDLGRATNGTQGAPKETRIEKVKTLWEMMFPGRELKLDHAPRIKWSSEAGAPYALPQMSDGETVGLYLVLRMLTAPAGVIIVDEPEVHLHNLLARQFWDVVEDTRKDCRFIYITHDLNFAVSRRDGRVGIVNSGLVTMVPEGGQVPDGLAKTLLGSATLSVVAERIVFCEGDRMNSLDVKFYSSWFVQPDTIVMPVGSCSEVRRTYSTFKNANLVKNAKALAIVERDYWPKEYLDTLVRDGLTVLSVHEIEGLLCLEQVFIAVAEYQSIPDASTRYGAFVAAIPNILDDMKRSKLVLERTKKDMDFRLVNLTNSAHPKPDLSATRTGIVEAVRDNVPDAGTLFDTHQREVQSALAGSMSDILRIVPSKDIIGNMLQKLGLTKEAYMRLITEALSQPEVGGKAHLETLRVKLVAALTPHLPPRRTA